MGIGGSSQAGPYQYGVDCPEIVVPEGCGVVRRHALSRKALIGTYKYDDGVVVATLFENFQRGVRVNPDGPCMGWREKDASGNVGPYQWLTYRNAWTRILSFGAGMHARNLHPPVSSDGHPTMRMLGIYAKNRVEWVIAEQASNAYGGVIVPLYDTLGPETIAYIVNQCELSTVVCGSAKEAANVASVKKNCPSLRAIVLMDEVSTLPATFKLPEGMELLQFREVEAAGQAAPRDPTPPFPDDVATFCYTSGTTGDPKGAMLTHKNIVADLSAAQVQGVRMTKDDVHLSYLPLPHMFERVVQCAMWADGAAVGFYQGDTQKIMEDLQVLRPTVFPSVPRLFNKVYDKITQKVEEGGGLKAWMFNKGRESKTAALQKTYGAGAVKSSFWDTLVFQKVRAQLGLDRCRVMLTGSAPIARHVMEFLRVAFCCPVCEGYGQTECAAACTLTEVEDQSTLGHVGGPMVCNEICLMDVPDMGYLHSDTAHGDLEVRGRGEVCYRGPNIFVGYYKSPDKTAEALDSEGWLHSGDIGVWTTQGALKIVDRKKNIFKLAQGEYVAAEKIENILSKSRFVEQIFVYGCSLYSSLVAIVVPNPDAIKAFAAEAGGPAERAAVCNNPDFKKLVQEDLAAVAKENKLFGFEKPRDIFLSAEPFTVENNMMTPTFKLKRKQAQDHFQPQIDVMYASEVIAGQTGVKQ
eukprot:TRINITY_DN39_c0_g1_i6.p1 TRINITY_DN39_c0_g1~~TRINITY_DN39_c0_g1_i6.p1  ORF type:complete len:693 (-),score=171.64 TRINITY_DN39_c0_g1_i6:680-2758(-)